jgi:hypothetical protein
LHLAIVSGLGERFFFLNDQDPETTCGAQGPQRSIDGSLSADIDGSGLLTDDPDYEFVDVSSFAQTPGSKGGSE